jgi:hypothetical protein
MSALGQKQTTRRSCDANVWRYFLFGAIFVRLRRERQALLRAREPPSIRRSTIKPSIASTK